LVSDARVSSSTIFPCMTPMNRPSRESSYTFLRLLNRRARTSAERNKYCHCYTVSLTLSHEYNPSCYFDSASDRSFPRLGLQFWMGILPIWRNRTHSAHCSDSRLQRPNLIRGAALICGRP